MHGFPGDQKQGYKRKRIAGNVQSYCSEEDFENSGGVTAPHNDVSGHSNSSQYQASVNNASSVLTQEQYNQLLALLRHHKGDNDAHNTHAHGNSPGSSAFLAGKLY